MNKSFFSAIVFMLSLHATVVMAQDKASLGTHVFFKHLVGSWKADGELKNGDGNAVKISEEWKGSAAEDGSFVMEGTRKINDSVQEYRWTIASVNGLYEVTHTVKGEPKPARFEASVSDVALTMQLSGFLNEGGSKLTVLDSFVGEDRDTLESDVAITDEKGQTGLSGKLIHKRVK